MLQPANRLTLVDAMRPPPGFALESAMAVTFTLDLRALLAAPAAFALSGPVRDDGGRGQEPIELLHALRSHAKKLTVFNQVGEIALPPARRVWAFLEQVVVPVRAPLGGVVHPKVWVLRYEPTDASSERDTGDRRMRVLVASRNLTFDASWDTIVRLDESSDGTGAELVDIGALFDGLRATVDTTFAEPHRLRVSSLVTALSSARFALPAGVQSLRTHVLGLERTRSPLPTDADRSLVISPFVSDGFFSTTHPVRINELVSRAESLDNLPPSSLSAVDSVRMFDDGSATELDRDAERLTVRDPGRPLIGLHAKVFAFEHGDTARLFLGSPNATGAAFSRNVEILLELEGRTSALGIDRLCEGSGDERGLSDLFVTYTPSERDQPPDDGISGLDAVRHAIADLVIEGFVDEHDTGWTTSYRSTDALPATSTCAVSCWPLSSEGHRRQVEGGVPLDVRFEVTVETISGFLAFEVVANDGDLTQFVVPVPLHGVPEHRDRALFRALIGNAERFLQYLLALLDEDPSKMELLDLVEATRHGDGAGPVGTTSLPVLEKLLRTMRRDPDKIAGIHPLVEDLAADHALPDGFIELWSMIHAIATPESERP